MGLVGIFPLARTPSLPNAAGIGSTGVQRLGKPAHATLGWKERCLHCRPSLCFSSVQLALELCNHSACRR